MLGLAAHPLPWLRISLRSRPRSSRRASCADPKHRAGAGEAPSSRRRAPAVHLRADGNEHVSRGKERVRTNGFELHGRRSPRRSIAPAARRYAHASACSQFIRTDQRGHWPWTWRRLSSSMLRIGAERPFCTWLPTHARAADTFRAAQARDSSGISARNSERANWPPLPVQAVAEEPVLQSRTGE